MSGLRGCKWTLLPSLPAPLCYRGTMTSPLVPLTSAFSATGLSMLLLALAAQRALFTRGLRAWRPALECLWERYPRSFDWSAATAGGVLSLAVVLVPTAAVFCFLKVAGVI